MITAAEFAKTHPHDADWVKAMEDAGLQPAVLSDGQRGTYSGFPATVVRHYRNDMYEIRVPGGVVCVDGRHFIPA